MGRFDTVERSLWQFATGSSHQNYRQALWRPTRQDPSTVALSYNFEGDPAASNWNRRSWSRIGVVAIRYHALEELLARPNVDPAVAFTMGDKLVVGRLSTPDDIGFVGDIDLLRRGHGMRIGPGDMRFGIGAIASNGEFITPPAENVVTMEYTPIGTVGDTRGDYGAMNFS